MYIYILQILRSPLHIIYIRILCIHMSDKKMRNIQSDVTPPQLPGNKNAGIYNKRKG